MNPFEQMSTKGDAETNAAKRQEKKEIKDLNIHNNTTLSGLKDRDVRRVEDPVNRENQYNYPGADEDLLGEQDYPKEFGDKRMGSKFVSVEELGNVGSDGEEMNEVENQAQKAIDKELKSIDDVYDFGSIINKLFVTLQEKGKDSKDPEREINNLLRRVNTFTVEYKNILKQGLPENKEYKTIQVAFKKIVGDVVYSDGQAEVLPRFIEVGDKKAPASSSKVEEEKRGTRDNGRRGSMRGPLSAYNTTAGKKELV